MAVPYTSNITYAFIFVIALLFGLLVYGLSDFVTTGAFLITISIGYPTLYGYIYRKLFRRTLLDSIQFYSICVLLLLCFLISNSDQLQSAFSGLLFGVIIVILSVLLVVLNNKFIASRLPKPKNQNFNQQNFDNQPSNNIINLNVNRSSGTEDSSTSDSNIYQNI